MLIGCLLFVISCAECTGHDKKSKKLIIDIDQNRAQAAGVSSQDISTSLQTVLDGFQTGEYREGDKS
ncbi:hypothetical protein, partial [Moritella sp.]|uniref:hypothetical protein n=1 Tax=Moritella sp. TaxID=78556 RepID=UPI0025E5DEA0